MNRVGTQPAWRVYFSGRMAALLGVGFASGLPLAMTQDTLVAWMAREGIAIEKIGLMSLVTLPYALKFAWAPLLDRFSLPWPGRRRGWMLLAQLLLTAALLAMAWAGVSSIMLLASLALLVAFFSASQDIMADAYRADVLPARELGAGAAVFVMGYRMAMIVSTAGLLVLAGAVGYRVAYLAAAGLMLLCTLVTILAPEPQGHIARPARMREAILNPLMTLIRSRGLPVFFAMLLFVVLFRLPDTLAGRLTMDFLLRVMHYGETDVGALKQFMGLWITIAGTLAGGFVVAKLGVVRSLWVVGVLQMASNAGFVFLAWLGPDESRQAAQGVMALAWTDSRYVALAGVVAVESFCSGLAVAGFIALLMSLCDRRYSATQYALLTSIMSLGGAIVPSLAGYLVAWWGYGWFFMMTILAGLPGLMLIPVIARCVRADDDDEAETTSLTPQPSETD